MEQEKNPPIVGIGASAGGIKALQTFFQALPSDTGAAFVVIVHLDPETPSELANILAARTSMPVQQVEGVTQLRGNNAYVIPPNCRLRISDHMIAAIPFDEPRGHRAPIDLFFRSLAEQHEDGFSFAVILTGAGADGANGVKAIKEAGGIVLVQDPNEAEYPSMPRSAIATEAADVILPISQLAERLIEMLRSREHIPAADLREGEEESLRRILAHIRVRTGHDFSQYKRATVVRRVTRRVQVTRRESLADYYAFLRDNVEEGQALFSDFLISVTTFFRDDKAFTSLTKNVAGQLFDGKEAGDAIRIWVPGCATGEEAYSIGILLLEEAGRRDIRPEIQVFGSDLDEGALAIAREGRYPASIESDLSEERLRRFFTKEGEHYRVRRELRDVILFASHSLLRDPPFSRLDMISCRNLLIYLDRDLQQQVCSTFHYALNPGGFLFLGSSESAEQPGGLFRVVDRSSRIYRSGASMGEKRPTLPLLIRPHHTGEKGAPVSSATSLTGSIGDTALHRQMLERVAPPSMLVDDNHRAVHLSENAGRFLQHSGGPVTADAAEMVRPELRFDVRAALHRAFERGEATLSMPISVRLNGSSHRIYLNVKPALKEGDRTRYALVLFIEGEMIEQGPRWSDEVGDAHIPENETIRQLREELQLVQSRLRATREDSEAANEELRAANEELQSINEEYRSTSEELETSKEELQSINEELQTVNNELKLKFESISRANSDLQNLMAATDVGTLFLDPSLRIKRFTPRLTSLFNITVNDEGRPITDFTHQLNYDRFADHALAVLRDLTPIEHEAQSRNGGWYLVRMRPYRTIDDKIDGVVATFVDISERRQIEQALRQSEERLRQEMRLVDLSRSPIFVWNFDGVIMRWNRGSERLYGFSETEAIGQRSDLLLQTSVPESSFDALRATLLENQTWTGELTQKSKDGRMLTVETNLELVTVGERRLVLESTRDVTDQRRSERRQKLLLSELTHRVKNTLTVVQSMARQMWRADGSDGDFLEKFEGRLSALSNAHMLLTESHWDGAELGGLVQNQLEPYLGADPKRLRVSGPSLILPSHLATPFGLLLHELATNAAKYGALSVRDGYVRLSWRFQGRNNPRKLEIVWEEQNGPPVKQPARQGLGTRLIQRGLPGAVVRHEFRANGVICTIEIDLSEAEPNGGED